MLAANMLRREYKVEFSERFQDQVSHKLTSEWEDPEEELAADCRVRRRSLVGGSTRVDHLRRKPWLDSMPLRTRMIIKTMVPFWVP